MPFELYFGLSVEDAWQIFYGRNVEGVPVAKNLAMSMDQRDIGTQLAHRVAEAVKVEHEGKIVPFSKLVQARKRQLTKRDPELVTLSAPACAGDHRVARTRRTGSALHKLLIVRDMMFRMPGLVGCGNQSSAVWMALDEWPPCRPGRLGL